MYRFNVPDMTCGHCAGTVQRAVSQVDAQAEVSIDLSKKEVQVRTSAPETAVGEAIRKAGYKNSILAI